MRELKANGKLLLTAEYAVLDGAKALCLPCKVGQRLAVYPYPDAHCLYWEAWQPNQRIWFTAKYKVEESILKLEESTNAEKAIFLAKILTAILRLNPTQKLEGHRFVTKLEFPVQWGLGTSSTLITSLAKWARINPYDLLKLTFGGSGYDIACALHSQPIFYTKKTEEPLVEKADFNPPYRENLYFLYLNKKQNSREAIKFYNRIKHSKELVMALSEISEIIPTLTSLVDFNYLLQKHEQLLSNHLGVIPIQQQIFKEYTSGIVKSLGAWGGDFVLVSANEKADLDYFQQKGYTTLLRYDDLVI